MRKIKKIKSYYVGKKFGNENGKKKWFFPDDTGLKILCKESIRNASFWKHSHNKN